jgi:transcriptional regulator with GAF, ATPase, and Fis domain
MQIRSNDPGSLTHVAPLRCPVWIWDEIPSRRKTVLNELREVQCITPNELPLYREPEAATPIGVGVFLLAGERAKSSDVAFISKLKERFAFVICVTGSFKSPELAASCQLLLAGATHVIDGHADDVLPQLRGQIQRTAERILASKAEDEALQVIMTGVGFAGRSAAAFSLFRTLRSISSLTDLPVLVTGETGTGKELIASAIHVLDSRRAQQPFVGVNCAALPEQISESELFGHQRGAFTGAERERAGLFRSADQGVLFLDEIAELSSNLQAKLLRVLQAGHLRSVGADREVAINVRVIAATNRRLDQMIHSGAFREDLFHRLNVLALHIPPLRERTADIRPLVHHFVEKYRLLWQLKGNLAIGDDFVGGLERAILPGNAREVENLVRRALVAWDGSDPLSLRYLPSEIWQEVSSRSEPEVPPAEVVQQATIGSTSLELHAVEYLQRHDWNLPHATRYLESVLVRGALSVSNGNQSEAARLLGITSRSVYNKLHKSCL